MTTETLTMSKVRLTDYGVYAAIALLVLYNIVFTENFLTWSNLRIQLVQVAPVVIVALGMALVIGTEGVDLSVGSVMALAAALIPLYLGYGLVAAIVVSLLAGVAVGLVNGTLVARVGLQPIAATLAGLPVQRVLITVYVVCAVLASIAGLLAVARIQSSDASAVGLLIELSAITAVVVGGTPLTGGRVRVLGTVAGALLMQLVVATMIKHNLRPSITEMAQAVIILVAVYLARERRTR
jgi:ribose/xylose/arabinose/galactoside ABC-type transport system permease subunit